VRTKEAVILAIRDGTVSREQACARYAISPEELAGWDAAYRQHGKPGLSATKGKKGEAQAPSQRGRRRSGRVTDSRPT